ncbi:MAG: SufD family Fe-S cluster assembly protein [Candidatus Micrarchaeaceae archaeon]
MLDEDDYISKYGFKTNLEYKKRLRGLSEEVIKYISSDKNEPQWMFEKRLTAYRIYKSKPLPKWGIDLSGIDFDNIYYYIKSVDKKSDQWENVPNEIKEAFDKLGVPEAEKKFFAGTEAQFDSNVVYGKIKKDMEKLGIIFTDMDSAIKIYPELVKKYFGTAIPPTDNKFAALNSAVWSGGSFIYIPKGIKVQMPLQAYFRINSENAGQFERTLIIAEDDSDMTYIEGCFEPGVEISTEKGIKKIEEICIGDRVLTHKNRYRKVYDIQLRSYSGTIYRITANNKIMNVTPDHPILVFEKEDKGNIIGKWIPAKGISESMQLIMPKGEFWNKGKGMTMQSIAYAIVAVEKVEEIEKAMVQVYNFSVEEDESYVANGVVVHNCTAPIYLSSSLHAANVEIIAGKNAHVRYVTVQNWSKNVYNLVTQRAIADENAYVEWIDANIGSKANMKYPSIYLKGNGARGSILSIGIAGKNQIQDVGGKIYHFAPHTSSKIISKNISSENGVSTYRGMVYVAKEAEGAKCTVKCDSMLINDNSKANTYPYIDSHRSDADISHEAIVGKISKESLFYLMTRGLGEDEAIEIITLGFIEPLAKELPLEYSIELKRLIKLDMPKKVG